MDARITLWNTGAEKLYGYRREEAVGQVSYRLLRTIFPEPFERILETLVREGQWSGELRKFAKDGREIHVATLWQLNRDAAGNPVAILEVGNDVTERNRLEEKARRWTRLFESAAFGLAHIRVEDDVLLEVNPAFARGRGYQPEELAGRPLLDLHPPEARAAVEKQLAEIDQTGHGTFEGEHVRKDGSRFPVLLEVTTLRGPMDGEIAVDTREGRGTTFYISLPLPPETRSLAPAAPPSRPRPSPADLRLLLAEDDAVSMLSFRRMLEKAGYTVDVAEDGAKALALVAERDYDCILMDVQMPVMDGVAATKAIRARTDAKASIPIIAMTAYAMAGDRERFLEAGMNGYVGKPVDMDELRQTIMQAVHPA